MLAYGPSLCGSHVSHASTRVFVRELGSLGTTNLAFVQRSGSSMTAAGGYEIISLGPGLRMYLDSNLFKSDMYFQITIKIIIISCQYIIGWNQR